MAEQRPTRVERWLGDRSYHADAYPLDRLVELKAANAETTVTVVLPAREVAETIGPILDRLQPLERAGVIDELVVVDAASADGTAAVAERHGATVVQESSVLPEFGPARGKGDALWRSLAVTEGTVVAFVDADTSNFDDRFLRGLLGPLLAEPTVAFVKGAFSRPFKVGKTTVPDGG